MQSVFSATSSSPFRYAPLPDSSGETDGCREEKRQPIRRRRAIVLLTATGGLLGFFLWLSYSYATSCGSSFAVAAKKTSGKTGVAVSYDKSSAPGIGCEAVVSNLQHQLITLYQEELRGIRYANLWGYLGKQKQSQ